MQKSRDWMSFLGSKGWSLRPGPSICFQRQKAVLAHGEDPGTFCRPCRKGGYREVALARARPVCVGVGRKNTSTEC